MAALIKSAGSIRASAAAAMAPEAIARAFAPQGVIPNSTVLIILSSAYVRAAAGTLRQAPGDQAAQTEGHGCDGIGDVSLHRYESRAGGRRGVRQVL